MNTSTGKIIQSCKSHISKFKRQRPLRAQSLLMTIYGDSILPFGGEVWLGSLINLSSSFGINQRLVRTSVYRLVQEQWLDSKKIGRRSYYYLADSAADSVMRAEKRIYSKTTRDWDGEWLLIFTGVKGINSDERAALRQGLLWQGFGQISTNVFGHPVPETEIVIDILKQKNVDDKVVVMKAKNFQNIQGPGIIEMVNQCFELNDIQKKYKAFIKTYEPIYNQLVSIDGLDKRMCFVMKTLLIHDYRKIILRDPHLPSELLDDEWAGNSAFELCKKLYKKLLPGAEEYLLEESETVAGFLPKVAPYYSKRFTSQPDL